MTALSLIEDPLFLLLANIQQERYFEQFKASGYDYNKLRRMTDKNLPEFKQFLTSNNINNRGQILAALPKLSLYMKRPKDPSSPPSLCGI